MSHVRLLRLRQLAMQQQQASCTSESASDSPFMFQSPVSTPDNRTVRDENRLAQTMRSSAVPARRSAARYPHSSASARAGAHSTPSSAAGEAGDERVRLNVGGRIFETYGSTLAAYPTTLLGAMFASDNAGLRRPDASGCYFFDRDPDSFGVILNFYRTHQIIIPPHVSADLVLADIEYFQLPVAEDHSDQVFMWGCGRFGQLGLGDRNSAGRPAVVETFRSTPAIVDIALGAHHTVALADNGSVYAWGFSGDGRLGHGYFGDEVIPKLMEILAEHRIVQVACGELHSAALSDKGIVFTWGVGKVRTRG